MSGKRLSQWAAEIGSVSWFLPNAAFAIFAREGFAGHSFRFAMEATTSVGDSRIVTKNFSR